MTLAQKDLEAPEADQTGRPEREAAIGKHVLRALGQPGDLLTVQVRPLWGDHYRVNIVVGRDATSTKVAHSYFLTVDPAGGISASNPQILREY